MLGAGFSRGNETGSISQRSGLGLDFQSVLFYTCTKMSVPEDRDTFTSLQEHFIQTASRFTAMTNCQELYRKPVEL